MDSHTVQLPVQGMSCGSCARSVQRKLAATPGVVRAVVSLEQGSAEVEYDPGRVQPDALKDAVRQLGYEVPQ
jgi:copper chaperone CopZ